MLNAIAVVIVWAAHFGAIYASTALLCERQAAGLVPTAVVAWTVVALAALAAIAVPAALRAIRAPALPDVLAAGLGALAALGAVWEVSSLIGVRGCG